MRPPAPEEVRVQLEAALLGLPHRAAVDAVGASAWILDVEQLWRSLVDSLQHFRPGAYIPVAWRQLLGFGAQWCKALGAFVQLGHSITTYQQRSRVTSPFALRQWA